MNKLAIFDIDDTIFFANQGIHVLDDQGNTTEVIDNREYHRRDALGETHQYSWKELVDAQAWYDSLMPNPPVIDRMIKDLADSDTEVILITGRLTVDNIPLFKAGFKVHGMNIDDIELVFAGDRNPSGGSTHLVKRVDFERLFALHYDHISIYEDSKLNLREFHYVSMDFPFTSTSAYWIDPKGNIKRYNG